jgi:hypothetical protein
LPKRLKGVKKYDGGVRAHVSAIISYEGGVSLDIIEGKMNG